MHYDKKQQFGKTIPMETQLERIKQAYNDSSPINSIEALDKFYLGVLESFRGTVSDGAVDRALQEYRNPLYFDIWRVHYRTRGFYHPDTQLICIDDNLKKTPIARRQTSIEECIHFLQAAQMNIVPNSNKMETVADLKATEQTAKIIRHLGIASFSPQLLRQEVAQCGYKAFAIFTLYDFIGEKLPTNHVAKLDNSFETHEAYKGMGSQTINNDYMDFVEGLYNFSQITLCENPVPYKAINSVPRQKYSEALSATLWHFFPEDSMQNDFIKSQQAAFLVLHKQLKNIGSKEDLQNKTNGYNYEEELASKFNILVRNIKAQQAVRKL